MTAFELKKQLIEKISEINDVSFLSTLKTIIDTKKHVLGLTKAQRDEILASQTEVKNGHFVDQAQIDNDFNQWASAK